MKQIYCVKIGYRDRWDMDERDGMVLRHEKVMQPADTASIVHAGKEYKIAKDSTFLVPDDVADHFLRMPDWNEGANPFGKPEMTKTVAV